MTSGAVRTGGPVGRSTTTPGLTGRRAGWRESRWVTTVEAVLGVAFTIGMVGSLIMAVVATVTFLGEPVTPSMRAGQQVWEQRAMWFAVGPTAAGVVLAAVARRRSAGWVFGSMLALGLVVVVGLSRPEPIAEFLRSIRDQLLR